jgi:uncharacterized protein with ACT and thioredoxin-like domain
MEQKDKKIKEIVKRLKVKFGQESIVLKDYWDADNFAIGLSNTEGENIVYISTWNKDEGKCYVSLEGPSEKENEVYEELGEFDNVSLLEMEQIVARHLNFK